MKREGLEETMETRETRDQWRYICIANTKVHRETGRD